MRHFDRILAEELADDPSDDTAPSKDEKGLRGQKLYDEMKRLYNLAGKTKGEERDRWRKEAEALKTEDNTAEWLRCFNRIREDNRGNKEFAKALEDWSHEGDNLATWMLRHLVNKAQSG